PGRWTAARRRRRPGGRRQASSGRRRVEWPPGSGEIKDEPEIVAAVRGPGPAGGTRGLLALVALSAAAGARGSSASGPPALMKAEAGPTHGRALLLGSCRGAAQVPPRPDPPA